VIGRFITKRNQVVVEVLEATGLRSSDLNGISNPYAKVGLICATKKRRVGSFANNATRTTYYVPKTLSPQWSDQSFVFDIPVTATDPGELRRVSIMCVLKSAEIGKNKFLGQGMFDVTISSKFRGECFANVNGTLSSLHVQPIFTCVM
jgi:Ca2+-dependent lipid-binding protein